MFWTHVIVGYDVRWVRCLKCIFKVWYFQLIMGLLGCNPMVNQGRSALSQWFHLLACQRPNCQFHHNLLQQIRRNVNSLGDDNVLTETLSSVWNYKPTRPFLGHLASLRPNYMGWFCLMVQKQPYRIPYIGLCFGENSNSDQVPAFLKRASLL